MKSSTIRRSTLSKESMEVIENLANSQNSEVGEYVRPVEDLNENESDLASKSQEIDLLWQSFKSVQFNTNSPLAYISLGIVIGVILSVLAGAVLISFSDSSKIKGFGGIFNKNKVEQTTLEENTESAQNELDAKIVVPSEDEATEVLNEETDSPKSESVEQAQVNVNTSKMKKYIVKDGDTGESIIKKYYGSYSPEKAELIIKANNLKNLDRINIDQELLIPVE